MKLFRQLSIANSKKINLYLQYLLFVKQIIIDLKLEQMSENQNTFDSFLQFNEQNNLADWLCVSTQFVLSVIIFYNIRHNWDQFPIKQLSPLCTLSALVAFFLTNIISLVGKIIEQRNSYFSYNGCGQCRLYENSQMIVLAVIYTGMRQFPLTIFLIKTLRVCVCFASPQNQSLHSIAKRFFNQQSTMILFTFAYSVVIMMLNLLEMLVWNPLTNAQSIISYEYFCPNGSGVFDWLLTIIRYMLVSIIYYLSTTTYKELDFKRFVIVVFFLDNSQSIMRLFISTNSIENHTYHQFYYHSIFVHLIGTLVLYPYSKYNQYVKQPPSEAILEKIDIFINWAPGLKIINDYASHLDQVYETKKFSECFLSYLMLIEIRKETFIETAKISKYLVHIRQILSSEDLEIRIENSMDLNKKIADKTLKPSHLKGMEEQLKQFCEVEIFRKWKKTISNEVIKKEFQHNLIIDCKMRSLNIQIGGS